MRAFGLISLLLAVCFGIWWISQSFTPTTSSEGTATESYSDMIDAARAIPGAPQE